jgi:hypothetical protein
MYNFNSCAGGYMGLILFTLFILLLLGTNPCRNIKEYYFKICDKVQSYRNIQTSNIILLHYSIQQFYVSHIIRGVGGITVG